MEWERKRINRLKVVLAEKGMTNKQLSEILDKDPAVISKWVTNAAQPNVDVSYNKCWAIPDGRISWWLLDAQWNRVRYWESM